MSKVTSKLIEIKEYRETRNENLDNDFMLTITSNLLNNLSHRNNFIHSQLLRYKSEKKELDKNLRVATGLYICSLITCWETFFRDLFIFISNHDSSINQRLATEHNSEIPLSLTIGEFYARKYNFQNLHQTREAFDYILQKETAELSEYFSNEVFNGLIFVEYAMIFKWIHEGNLKTKIDETLHSAFKIRHRVTHDANYLIEFDPVLLSEIECVFQMIPQFFISHFAKKYSQKRVMFNKVGKYVRITDNPIEDEVPYIFNVKDFMANNWQVVE
ncbi:hypothetical protein [Flavobacterium maritimum]|uniref:hypothetical protein n=1 Tax=Flavobacterium maritimum TaxID=3149042 RepID=UPI0032B4ABC3